MDFSVADNLDTAKFNRVLWEGTMGNRPYPARRSGVDLRENREPMLAHFYEQRGSEGSY